MELTPRRVSDEHEWVRSRSTVVVPILNETRDRLGALFETDVAHVSIEEYEREVDRVFADGDLAVNVAAYVAILRDLHVSADYPGFVVDEVIGRKLAGTIAGGEPLSTLAEATFHFADVHVHGEDGDDAGVDDLNAALAAGFQTRLPGWDWRESDSPFTVE